jgi:hypothetical protein
MTKNYHIICGQMSAKEIQKVSYFKMDLGTKHISRHSNKPTEFNFAENFVQSYYQQKMRILMKHGVIGTINVYIDYGLKAFDLVIFLDDKKKEFVFDHCQVSTDGSIDKYIGLRLKEVEDLGVVIEAPIVNAEESKDQKVFLQPGLVKWEDLVAYKEKYGKK